MGFQDGLRDDAALLGTLGAAAHLREQRRNLNEQRKNTEELIKQGKALEVIAESEKARLSIEEQRLEVEKQRVFNEEYDRKIKEARESEEKENIKLLRQTLTAIDKFLGNLDSDNLQSIDYLGKVEIGLWETILLQLEKEDKLNALEDIKFLSLQKGRFEKINESLIASGSLSSTAQAFTETEYADFDKDAESVEKELEGVLKQMLSKSFLSEYFNTNSREKALEKLRSIESEINKTCRSFKERNDIRIVGNNNVELWTSFGDKFGEEEDLPLINDLIQIGSTEETIARELDDSNSPVMVALRVSLAELKNLLQEDGKARTDNFRNLGKLYETLETSELVALCKESPLLSIYTEKKGYLQEAISLFNEYKESDNATILEQIKQGKTADLDPIHNGYREINEKLNKILSSTQRDSALHNLIQKNASEFENLHKTRVKEIENAKQKRIQGERRIHEKFMHLANDYKHTINRPSKALYIFMILISLGLLVIGIIALGKNGGMAIILVGIASLASLGVDKYLLSLKWKFALGMAKNGKHWEMINYINQCKNLDKMKKIKFGDGAKKVRELNDKYKDLGISV